MAKTTKPQKLDPVRSSVSKLVPDLKLVAIDQQAIEDHAVKLANEEYVLEDWTLEPFLREGELGASAEDVLDFLFVGNSINFAFRDFETGEKFAADYDGDDWRGAFGMWACLKKAYKDDRNVLSGETLSRLTMNDVADLFESPNGVQLPMMEDRLRILNQVGDTLASNYCGKFHNFIVDTSDALYDEGEGIVDRLVAEFPSFDDSYQVMTGDGNQKIRFYKRAQLAPAMAYGRYQDSLVFRLQDIDNFTIFVDYNLPNVLRHLGIIQYNQTLSRIVDNREMIPTGSREEIEIRTATLAAADLLMTEINKLRETPIYGPHLDSTLFFMRNDPDTQVHRTKTIAY